MGNVGVVSFRLPASSTVDVAALSRVFANTTNSYKYLWLQAILQCATETHFKTTSFSLTQLLEAVLVLAWYPRVFFRLSFGLQDDIGNWYDKHSIQPQGKLTAAAIGTAIRAQLPENPSDTGLLRYVPYRLLTPFFENELKGKADSKKNALIRKLSAERFDETKPLYQFKSEQEIEIHPEWLIYLSSNLAIVQGWMHWGWVQFLQGRNVHVPAISNKLVVPSERAQLNRQKRFWQVALQSEPVYCIYSNSLLSPRCESLDQ